MEFGLHKRNEKALKLIKKIHLRKWKSQEDACLLLSPMPHIYRGGDLQNNI
jgi:hypothetical protein